MLAIATLYDFVFNISDSAVVIWIDGEKTDDPSPDAVRFGDGKFNLMTGYFAQQDKIGSQETCVGIDLYASDEPSRWRWLDCSRKGIGICEQPN